MLVDVALSPRCLPADRASEKVVVVVDVLRAGTTVAFALHHGAEAVIPVRSVGAARELASRFPGRALLCGERRALPLAGFDLGNSPLEFTAERVRGKVIVLTTSNATRVFYRLREPKAVALVGLVNAPAASRWLAALGEDVLIACAGRGGELGIEDAFAAGVIVNGLRELVPAELTDSAFAAGQLATALGTRVKSVLWESKHGRYLRTLGLESDLEVCAQVGTIPILAVLEEGKLVAAFPPE
jgi:2-phosphosulfolactate phosphatase